MAGFTQSPRFLLKRYSNAELPKAGVNICAWLVPSLGVFPFESSNFLLLILLAI